MAKRSRGKVLWFSFNCKSFPTNYGLVDWLYKSTSTQLRKFYSKSFSTQNVKLFPLECFVVYGSCGLNRAHDKKFTV